MLNEVEPVSKALDLKLKRLEAISKIVDHVQGRDANRFKHGVYTLVFEYFESVCNNALGR
jgi:hypothetical protein